MAVQMADACEIRGPGPAALKIRLAGGEENYTNDHADATVKHKVAAMPTTVPTTTRRHPSPNVGCTRAQF